LPETSGKAGSDADVELLAVPRRDGESAAARLRRMSVSKRQQTAAKRQREQALLERRQMKQAKKAARKAKAADPQTVEQPEADVEGPPEPDPVTGA
jgi:hypothetical protein